MKANAVSRLLSSLVWTNQDNECKEWQVSWNSCESLAMGLTKVGLGVVHRFPQELWFRYEQTENERNEVVYCVWKQAGDWGRGMNSTKLVIPLHSSYWSIHTKDESKRGTAFAFIFGVNWLWRCGVTASFGVFFNEMKCNRMLSFMEFMGSMQRVPKLTAAEYWCDAWQISSFSFVSGW